MTVEDLIAILQDHEPSAIVMVVYHRNGDTVVEDLGDNVPGNGRGVQLQTAGFETYIREVVA